MSLRALTIGAAVLVWAAPVAAQQRGTMEFGAFGSAASFDESLSLKSGVGGGGRIGMYLTPSLAIEFEDAEMRASRPNGLANVSVGILSGRLVATPFRAGSLSFLMGVGAGVSTETNFLHSYGADGLVGARLALTDNTSLRVDGVLDWLECHTCKAWYRSVRVGVSFTRHPQSVAHPVTAMTAAPAPMPPMATTMAHEDSVSAAETRRLRMRDVALAALRDSLGKPRVVAAAPVSSASALATMEERIHFDTDKSDLSSTAKSVLDSKVPVFRANPVMRIAISGNTDERASDSYNMALGERRSAAAKAYLVAQGIDAGRITITSRGERNPASSGTSKSAEAQNRRDEFHLLVSSDPLVSPNE
ncbi:MAG: pal [Gemmatimonadetes bacterium]|nr:pal [Gemmatimonadota bacterium]